MMKVIGLLNDVRLNDEGYVQVEIEGLRLDAGKLDDYRLAKWRALIDKEVVAVVAVQWRQSKNGRVWVCLRVLGLYEVRNGEVA